VRAGFKVHRVISLVEVGTDRDIVLVSVKLGKTLAFWKFQ